MGADLHGFKELEGKTMRSCDACGKTIKPWQKATDFEVMTTLKTPVRLHTHEGCADTAAAAAHMKPHRRTLLCALLGCNSSSE